MNPNRHANSHTLADIIHGFGTVLLVAMLSPAAKSPLILTIGHSNRTIEAFLELVQAHGVQLIADVRKMPGSRTNPQFNGDALAKSLGEVGAGYVHLPGLGGLRKGLKDSPNGAWENKSFRAYADYMLTREFEKSLDELVRIAQLQRVAIMCSEAVPWRCHRSLVADALVVRGIAVEHIMSPTKRNPHTLRSWAHVEGTRITYPPSPASGQLF
jgi:uncharacterized protein (DUF488 family)